MDVWGKKVTVVGLGRSGLAAAQLLVDLGAEVTVTDKSSAEAVKKRAEKLKVWGSVKVEVGKHSQEAIEGADLIVVSPGVPPDSPPFTLAREKGIPLMGELELGACWCPAPIIAVTGTNGKSTTVTLTGELLKAAGRKVIVAGNIGNPLCAKARELSKDGFAVVEVSSFQLETIGNFRPFIAAILNVSADHLDRYHNSFSHYLKVKERLLSYQEAEDFAVLNADDDNLCKDSLYPAGRARTFFFSRQRQLREGVFVEGGKIISQWGGKRVFILTCDELNIKGTHNLENALAATAIAVICKVEPRIISGVLRRFPGLPHRLEFVDEIGGVRFINDSKGTNVGAVARSLEGLKGGVILIAGGRDKGGDYAILKEPVKEKVKALILLGEAKDKIKKDLAGTTYIKEVDSLEEAVRVSYSLAVGGETVLLSPACASFDMFKNFEERGRVFKKAVGQLR